MKRKAKSLPYEMLDGDVYPTDVTSQPNNSANNNFVMNVRIDDDEEEITLKSCCHWCHQRYFTKEKLKRRFPIVKWLPNYSFTDLKGDIVAGLSVAFTILPQGLAYAVLAGLPAHYGLYTSFMGCFVYTLFGSVKDVAVGPTSIMSIIVTPYVLKGGSSYAILLSFFTGLMMFILGILNLGFLVDFISYPVISGFTSAAAITIIVSQLKGFFGLRFSAARFLDTLSGFFANVKHLRLFDTLMGTACLAFLIFTHLAKDFKLKGKKETFLTKTFNTSWWLFTTGRNAVVVLVCALIAYLNYDSDSLTLTNKIKLGLPPFQSPFNLVSGNSTVSEIAVDLGTGVVVMSLIGLLETVAVAKAFMPTKKLDATQEMIALGLCNVAGSFVGAFPATGSFSRSAINHNSGVRTPFGGAITGGLVILALNFLGPYFEYIPQTVLSSIVIAAVVFMIRYEDPIIIWKTNKIDVLPYFATLISSILIGLEYGIVIGVVISVAILLYHMARPRVYITTKMTPSGDPFLYIKPDRSVFYPSIEYMKVKITKALPECKAVAACFSLVIDGEHMFKADSTFALGLLTMIESFKHDGMPTLFYNLKKPLIRSLKGVSMNSMDYILCLTEKDIYAEITTYKGQHKNTVSLSDSIHESLPAQRYWASHSTHFQ